MKIKDIENLTLAQLKNKSQDELKAITNTIAAYANRMSNDIERSAFSETSSHTKFKEKGRITSVYSPGQTKSKDDLIKEIVRAQNYTTSAFSTVKKLQAQKTSVEQRLGREFDSEEQYVEFWNIYNKIKDFFADEFDSHQAQNTIKTSIELGASFQDILNHWRSIYEKAEMEKGDKYDPFSLSGKSSGPLSGDYQDI